MPFFARSLTLVPRSLLLNRTETLATQANHKDVIDIDGIITEFARLKGTHLADL